MSLRVVETAFGFLFGLYGGVAVVRFCPSLVSVAIWFSLLVVLGIAIYEVVWK